MTGLDLFLGELAQYSFKAVVLLLAIVLAVVAGAKIRKAVNKKKEQK